MPRQNKKYGQRRASSQLSFNTAVRGSPGNTVTGSDGGQVYSRGSPKPAAPAAAIMRGITQALAGKKRQRAPAIAAPGASARKGAPGSAPNSSPMSRTDSKPTQRTQRDTTVAKSGKRGESAPKQSTSPRRDTSPASRHTPKAPAKKGRRSSLTMPTPGQLRSGILGRRKTKGGPR